MNAATANRIEATNGKATTKPRKASPKRKASRKPNAAQKRARAHVKLWSARYVYGAIAGSVLLNGYACYEAAGIAGAVASATIPLFVLGLAKAAGWSYRGGLRTLALVLGIIGTGLLATSLIHVSTAIAELTASSLYLGWAMAIGLDCGLVASETASIIVDDTE